MERPEIVPITNESPLVSVLMITYRHEPFIGQAIESVLMQDTNFGFELVIGEDRSPDGTLDIIRRYQLIYPGKIRLLAREHNLGMMDNLIDAYYHCQGTYVALLEGDDYWTDRDKLQIQVEALESHPDWALCFHRARYVSEDGNRQLSLGHEGIPSTTTLNDLLDKNYIPTLSILFRRDLIDTFPPWYRTLSMGDWPLTILLARHGNIGYLERTMGDYRVHQGGVYSGSTTRARLSADADMYLKIRPILEFNLVPKATAQIIRLSVSIIACDLTAKDYASALSVLRVLLRTEHWSAVFPVLARAAFRRLSSVVVTNAKIRNAMPAVVQRAIEYMTRR